MVLNRLLDDYEASITPDKPTQALLGAFINGVFQKRVATNPALAYVRDLNNQSTTVKHRNMVDLDDPDQNVPISLFYDAFGALAILDLEPNQSGATQQRNPNAGNSFSITALTEVTSPTPGTTYFPVSTVDGNRKLRADHLPVSPSNRLLYLDLGAASSSTTSPVSIWGGVPNGSRDLPADWWTEGRFVIFEFTGILTGDITPPAFTISLGFEGEATVDFSFTLPTASFSGKFRFYGRLYTSNPGATATFAGDGELHLTDDATSLMTFFAFYLQTAGATIDTTNALTLDALMSIDAGSPNEWSVGDYLPPVIKLEELG